MEGRKNEKHILSPANVELVTSRSYLYFEAINVESGGSELWDLCVRKASRMMAGGWLNGRLEWLV